MNKKIISYFVLTFSLMLSTIVCAQQQQHRIDMKITAIVVEPANFYIEPRIVFGNIEVKPFRNSNDQIGAAIKGSNGEVQF